VDERGAAYPRGKPGVVAGGGGVMAWQKGQRVSVVQGGQVLREAAVERVMPNGDAIIDSGNRFCADGQARKPQMREAGFEIRASSGGE
jgi:6-phosphogluconate dehydrogenase